jgi:hypothetical protein
MARRLLAVIVPAVLIFAPVAEAQTTVKVPNVVGKKVGAARRIIQQADLTPRVRKRSSSKPAGTVIRQQPTAGRRVNEGRTILLVVAKAQNGGGCTPGYSPCIPIGPDVDCAGGTGDGPRYEGQGGVPPGPFQVTGSDPYGLDGNNNGVGCE